MDFKISNNDLEWIHNHYPKLVYNAQCGVLHGSITISMEYRNCPLITDTYQIKICIVPFAEFPCVYEIDGKIKRYALIRKKQLLDFHQFRDGRLCLIKPNKIGDWYGCSFSWKRYMENIESYLYWVSYVYRYNQEPWPGEPHAL